MKKHLISLAFILSIGAIQAASYGKFHLEVNTGYFDSEKVEFLLNSSGEVRLLENRDWYTVTPSFFFGELSLTIQSGGDEEFILGKVILKDNQVQSACAAFVDAKNEVIEFLGATSFKLKRWNKRSKSFAPLYSSDQIFDEKCVKKLLEEYPEFEVL